MDFATADLIDDFDAELRSCETQFTQYGARTTFAGQVVTIRCHRDNGLVKKTLNSPGDGQVLVVDGGASLASALMGDMIAAAAVSNGWTGVVINGAVRDVATLRTLNLGIKALGSNPRKSAKEGTGEKNPQLTLGTTTITPGDWLYSDEDGLLLATRPLI
ncbi:ribonuclease E activity regulator RraA [Actinomadura flavalba]|uniref:ribonuclease E activity regulator RraA n=1 Tax=Actinomadura flavalba TaxID=1120938 RepID=UPI000361A75F|nr:ribonuclease E activity regulator RraA [Actinomadura flavalba]